MSEGGIVKLGTDEYFEIGSHGISRSIPARTFLDTGLFSSEDSFLTQGLGVREELMPQVNILAGKFMHDIHEASLVPFQAIRGIVPSNNVELYRWSFSDIHPEGSSGGFIMTGGEPLCTILPPGWARIRGNPTESYCSTLSPDALRLAIRKALDDLLRNFVPLLPKQQQRGFKMPPPSKVRDLRRNRGMTFHQDMTHDNALADVDFLTIGARSILHHLNRHVPDIINELLGILTRQTLCEADAEYVSVRHDMTVIEHMVQEGGAEEKDIHYSTLNSAQLIELFRERFFANGLLFAGAALRLPKAQFLKLTSRMATS